MFCKLPNNLQNPFLTVFMKKVIILIAAIAFSITAFCQGGVNFEHLTFDEALAKAKAENKLVFMDCYTSWCGPCKYMAETIFPQEKAGEFFNPKFISVKFDMEKGEGPELAKKFGVRAYPTFFIIRPDGTVQHTIVGGGDLEGFIARVERGLNEKTSLDYLNKAYEKGKMNKKQLMNYSIALQDAYDEAKSKKINTELNAVLKDKDKLKKDFWPILENDGYGSENFKFVVKNLPAFRKNIGKEKVDAYLFGNYSMAIDNSNRGPEPAKTLEQIRQDLSTINLEKNDELMSKIELAQAIADQDVAKIISFAEQAAQSGSKEVWPVMNALNSIKNKASKEELGHIAELGDKFIANAPAQGKDYMENFFESFKIAAYTGVYFQDLTFEQALEKAKKLRKKIFIDCYTSWCGPCKYMANTVFKQENVGDFLNKNFICLKYDMEKGEGPELMKKFGVRAFPTFVILNPDGTVRHKLVGGGEGEQFIERVKESFDDNKALSTLTTKYENGDRDKAFLLQYTKTLNSLYDATAKDVAAELMNIATDEEKLSPDYSFIFLSSSLSPKDSEAEKFLLANREKFNTTIGKEKVDGRLSEGLYSELMRSIASKGENIDAKRLDAIGKEIKTLKLSNEKSLLALQTIAKAVKAGNIDRLLSTCEKELSKIDNNQYVVYYLSGAFEKATSAQKTRWQKIMQGQSK